MPEETDLTSDAEPESQTLTSDAEPGRTDGEDSTTESPAPSIEELTAKLKRLEANVSGSTREARRLKAELETERQRSGQAQQIISQYQTTQQQIAPRPAVVNLEDEERDEQP